MNQYVTSKTKNPHLDLSMTVEQAIETVRSSGGVELEAGRIRCRVARSRPPDVEAALTVIRERKPEALRLLEEEPLERVLKGTAVALYSNLVKQTLWLVADEEDARKLGEPRGTVYTADEIRLITTIDDPEAVRAVHALKEKFNVRAGDPRHLPGSK